MPVPASFNDITTNTTIRNWFGWVSYQTDFYAPPIDLKTQSLYLHFGSVHFECQVYVNNQLIGGHVGGHLPFETLVPDKLLNPQLNNITVLVNNQLSSVTIPQASLYKPSNTSSYTYPANYTEVKNNFDFFNYAGIHRSVHLYVVPKVHIEKIKWTVGRESEAEELQMASLPSRHLSTDQDMAYFAVNYTIAILNLDLHADVTCTLNVIDQNRNVVQSFDDCRSNNLSIHARVWQPKALTDRRPYLYTVQVQLMDSAQDILLDEYMFTTGFRTIRATSNQLLVNGRPVYLTGFGRHEDSPISGRGFNAAFNVHDHNLIQWIGANCYRTSHYPYSEQLMQLADEQGILIINEVPAVGLTGFGEQLLTLHLQLLRELVARDQHRPSTIMWSIANEPVASQPNAASYFQTVANLARSLDSTRPITAALADGFDEDLAAPQLDVIMINRYFAWYSDNGHLELIALQMTSEVQRWRSKFQRPLLISEYGVDAVPGAHSVQPLVFSEEYQVAYLKLHFETFDSLRADQQLVGELIWNFADFMTDSSTTRVMGNRKGIFSRDRQPKSSAYLVRDRYLRLEAVHRPLNRSHFSSCDMTHF
jgi:beta-glucuronidase